MDAVEVEETHISTVFLTGPLVYKVKKPVDLGFLDFSTLPRRREACDREVSLNQRLSDDVYRGTVAITESEGRLSLGGDGEPVEHAVEMRQLPPDTTLEHHVEDGTISTEMIRRLADTLAAFHGDAASGQHVSSFGSLEAIGANVRENFDQIEPYVGSALREDFYRTMRQSVETFLATRRGLFESRIRTGRIRDGHGDLRLDHVYFVDGIQIIDCIEFNERFRYGDVAADLAFLLTELDLRRAAEYGDVLARRYAHSAGDPEIFALLPFYENYRALVRTKVECLRLDSARSPSDSSEASQARRSAQRYLELAHRYARILNRPTLWVVCGPVASGKTTVADQLGRRLGLDVHRSDAVRKELAGLEPEDSAVAPLGAGLYSEGMTDRTYRELLELGSAALSTGRSLVLDATYSRQRHRLELRDAARRLGANIVFFECRAPRSTLRRRLDARESGRGLSDARGEHLNDLLDRFETLDEIPSSSLVRLETAGPLHEALLEAFAEGSRRQREQSLAAAD